MSCGDDKRCQSADGMLACLHEMGSLAGKSRGLRGSSLGLSLSGSLPEKGFCSVSSSKPMLAQPFSWGCCEAAASENCTEAVRLEVSFRLLACSSDLIHAARTSLPWCSVSSLA